MALSMSSDLRSVELKNALRFSMFAALIFLCGIAYAGGKCGKGTSPEECARMHSNPAPCLQYPGLTYDFMKTRPPGRVRPPKARRPSRQFSYWLPV